MMARSLTEYSRLQGLLSGYQLPDESPGDLSHFTGVIGHLEMATQIVIHFHTDRDGLRGDLVGFADGGLRFEKTKAVFELDIEGVLPTQIPGVSHTGVGCFAERLLQLNRVLHRRPSCI